jgi:pimeloyl-ACP methyl ester carboxylesterase
LNVLIQQPEVDPKRIIIIAHSEGTVIAPRIAIDNLTKVKNIVLMGIVAQNLIRDILHYQDVYLPSEYAKQVLDKNHTGMISIQQIAKDPVFNDFFSKGTSNALAKEFGNEKNSSDYISIDKKLNPILIKTYENMTAFNLSKCNNTLGCPIWIRSYFSLLPTLSIIGNISKSTGILILNGENDSLTPVQQAFILQQRLTEVNHPDHTLITYPNLGHGFSPSSQWSTGSGPFEQYVLADIYAWLEAHSGLSHSFATSAATTSNIENMTSSTNTTSNSSSSSNR